MKVKHLPPVITCRASDQIIGSTNDKLSHIKFGYMHDLDLLIISHSLHVSYTSTKYSLSSIQLKNLSPYRLVVDSSEMTFEKVILESLKLILVSN